MYIRNIVFPNVFFWNVLPCKTHQSGTLSKIKQTICLKAFLSQDCYFQGVGINSNGSPSITLFRAEWQQSLGARRMIDGIALTNTGTGRRFTVAVLCNLAILLPPHQRFNPSHTQMSQCPPPPHSFTHMHGRVWWDCDIFQAGRCFEW